MTILINLILLVTALGLLIPILVLFIECSLALLPKKVQEFDATFPPPSIAVLVPAHNEESGIATTLKELSPQLKETDRLIVIADNCEDQTAGIARNYKTIVLERFDQENKGKGYALDYGLKYLEADPPEIVVMVDADCVCHPGTIDRIAKLAGTTARPVQAVYLMEQPPLPTPKDSISALAFMVKNLVRPKGLSRLGLPCPLGGTGMAFPWSVIQKVSLASGNIVEDLQLGLDLAIAGTPPILCLQARVIGMLPQQEEAAKSQRTRWEHGYLKTLLTQVPKLVGESFSQKRFDLLAMAMDLSVPPLSLLVILWVVATVLGLLVLGLGVSWIPFILLLGEGILIIISIFGAWVKFGRSQLPLLTLLAVPLYVLWKIPIYLAFLAKPESKWVRTARDETDTSKS
ncbi:MAG: glycosyltransferase family 2 protein [Microcoleaceae cyanobacterium MO_207.B10]|nr:glycosyltransferase family 2 protein [Microcoleaceae cyanobacterium MO_207.B10]